ncbi:ATP-binding protein [Actinomadura flavalba]|uniref:ATP-binding protein n=1 Tax=Actinomadura flavalba TaxID=1120938 RepID=UPI0003727B7C|nr:ATP-binding protein [Actinomadura flavalba]
MPSLPIPESTGLPPELDDALLDLVDPAGPADAFHVLPDPESVTDARHFTLARLSAWDACGLADDVGLVVSELVTNALRHSGGHVRGVRHWSVREDYADPLGSAPMTIQLRLLHRLPWLLCGIVDASAEAPRRKEPDYIAETGRGLHLVESFTTLWGWRGLPSGKVVWALFREP